MASIASAGTAAATSISGFTFGDSQQAQRGHYNTLGMHVCISRLTLQVDVCFAGNLDGITGDNRLQ